MGNRNWKENRNYYLYLIIKWTLSKERREMSNYTMFSSKRYLILWKSKTRLWNIRTIWYSCSLSNKWWFKTKHRSFKKVLLDIESSVKKGLLLSDALARHPGVFNNLYISLVKAGEVSGKLSITLEELSQYLETMEDTQRKVKSAMYYPAFILFF